MKKNPIAAMIVAKAKPAQDPEDMADGGADDDKEGRLAAAEDILQALDKRDAEALAQALHAFYQMC